MWKVLEAMAGEGMRQGSEEEHYHTTTVGDIANPTGNSGKWRLTVLRVINPRVRQVGY